MPIFKIEKNKLNPISEKKIDLERDVQKITEENLEAAFGLKFVSSEYTKDNFRIDTIAFDPESKSFVIIEFKKDRSFSVIDQGFAYLALMLKNKADFILEYNEKMKYNLKRGDVDWSQSKVVFISNSFTAYQQNAINFKDLPIELWEVKKYDGGIILYNQLKSPDSSESIKTITKNKTIENISREVKKYTIDDHFKPNWNKSRELFEFLREKILSIDPKIVEEAKKFYIGYKVGFYNVCSIHVQKSLLFIHLVRVDKEDLNDPRNKIIKEPWKKHGSGKLCRYNINNFEDIDYAIFLIKQVYEKFYR